MFFQLCISEFRFVNGLLRIILSSLNMTTLIDKIEKLIKREKTTPDRKNDDSTKTSSEILSELFSAFNADPPKIDDTPIKKPKKSKKRHKKEKKKRSRSASSSSDSNLSEYSRKRKKSKKSKSKKNKDNDRSPRRYSKAKPEINHVKKEKVKNDLNVKTENHVKSNGLKSKHVEDIKIKHEVVNKTPISISIKDSKDETTTYNTIDASLIPLPESPKTIKSEPGTLKPKFDKKEPVEIDKSKGKIQIKNLKFSAVFEETVKKAEEEARKKAEKVEDGECTASSSGSESVDESNSQFPKSADPGGILKKQAAEETKACEEEKLSSNKEKLVENSHKSRKERSSSPKRSRSKSKRSRSRSTSRRRSSSKRRRYRSRSRSRSQSRRKSRGRDRSSSRSRKHSKSRTRHKSRSRSRHRSPRPWSRRRSRSPSGVKLADSEKKRLLEVARRNAINMLKNGAVPAGAAALPPHTRNQVMAAIQSGGKSVDELTDFCKHLSKKEALGELSSVSSNDEDMSDNEDTIAFHHPFLVKEKAPIVMNIRGGAPLPTKTSALPVANKDELRLQFPVSSGTQHRASEWVPVSPNKDDNMQLAKLNSKTSTTPLPVPAPPAVKAPLALPEPPKVNPQPYLKSFTSGSELTTVPALPAPGPQALPPNMETRIDVAAIVSQKLALIRKEQEQNEISETHGFGWSKTALGQFTGSTGANILTPRELASGTQAWAKKDQLVRAAPVEGGMGMHLLQKMGWTPGQGLGKEGTGTLQPLLLEVKLDTRGLQAREEATNKFSKSQRIGRRGPAPLVAGGKHPVSLLGEYCSKQKLGPPEYTLCFECGPDHKKNFLFKVKVANVEYQPAVASANKKQAKADAAQLALHKLGILTKT